MLLLIKYVEHTKTIRDIHTAEYCPFILISKCPIMVFHVLMYIMCVPNISKVPFDKVSIYFFRLK